jgi:hypothetical protein
VQQLEREGKRRYAAGLELGGEGGCEVVRNGVDCGGSVVGRLEWSAIAGHWLLRIVLAQRASPLV